MQPYLFPYFPYLQLLACVDIFVIFDTAQFISRGWANRNVVDLSGTPHVFVLPVQKHSRDTPFSHIRLAENFESDLARVRATLNHANSLAPFPSTPQRLIDQTFPAVSNAGASLVEAFERMSGVLMEIIGFETQIVRASHLAPRSAVSAQDYIINLVSEVGGGHYINPIGGAELYDSAAFHEQGLRLSFLKTTPSEGEFRGDLSILHSLAHHAPIELRRRLDDFILLSGSETLGSKID